MSDRRSIDQFTLIEPVYQLTEGLPLKSLAKAVRGALQIVPEMPEWLDKTLLRNRGWPSFREAISAAHAPESEADLSPESPARLRLAYDELLANQLALALLRVTNAGAEGPRIEECR